MKKFTLFFALILAVSTVFAQLSWVSFTSENASRPTVNILDSDHSGLTLEVSISGMYTEEATHEDMTFQRISLLDGRTTKEVGRPELPMLHQLIGIPDNQKVSYRIVEMQTMNVGHYNIYPFQTPTTDNPGGHSHEFVIDNEFYSRSANYPQENVVMDNPSIWRDVKVTSLHMTPFTYNPATGELFAVTYAKIEVEFSGFDPELVLNRSKEISPKFYNIYESAIPNFGQMGYTTSLRENPGIKYLVITNTEALDAIQPLVDWKNQMGHKVEVRTLETGFNTAAQFKAYISDLYDTDGLEYVLMVGDAYPNGGTGGGPNVVPMYWWAPGGEDASYSDSWYTCLDGADDHYADLAIGRFVYDNNAILQLELQIDKTMNHYLTPDVSDNWAENTLLIAHKEQYPGKYTLCSEEIRTYPYNVQVPIFETAYGGAGATNQDVIDFVNGTGVGVLNYRGHGSATELWEWGATGSFVASHVNQLTNADQLFVFFDVCCDNMDIVAHAGNCLCESFMKHSGGSVAVNSAIIPSYTIPNHDYDKEMYKALFDENITNIGYVTNFANVTVLNVHGTIGRSNVRTYLWLGDASIEPWTLQPMDLTVTHDEQIFLGVSEFNVNVIGQNGPAENAMVCVSNEDGSIYSVAYTDNAGVAMVTFDEPVQTPGEANVTVTLHNYLPYQAVVPVIPQDGPYVVKDTYAINDDDGNGNGMMDYGESILLTLGMKNVGIEIAENVVVTMTTIDDYVTITDGEEAYGNIDPDATVTVDDGFAFDVAEDIPDGHAVLFELSATDGTDVWGSNLVLQGHAPNLQFDYYTIDDASGNNNGFLDPGETAEMTVFVKNNGSADAYNVDAELTSTDPMLTVITTGVQAIGDLEPDATGEVTYTVEADAGIVPGYTGEFNILFTADMGISQEDVIQIPFADYCEASTTTEDEWIAQVICGDIDNSSSWQGGVANYTDITTTLEAGVGEPITIENGNAWASDIVYVWVDWNLDKELGNNTDETFQLTNVGGSGQTFTGQITPPADQPDGQYRMRVRMTYSTAPTPCGSASYGEVEDYTVLIAGTLTAAFTADVTQGCEDLTVNFSDNSSGDVISWDWTFEGGDPATSTDQNPTVTYALAGDYDVTLVVDDGTNTNTSTEADYISILDIPEMAATPTGDEEVCENEDNSTYTTTGAMYATEYVWMISPVEAGTISGDGMVGEVDWADDYHGDVEITVYGTNECGDGDESMAVEVTVEPMPEAADNIAGNEQGCQGYTEIYSVPVIMYADSYTWTMDPPEAGTTTENMNECTVVWSDTYEGAATMKVCGGNNCGNGPWSAEFEVMVANCTGIGSIRNNGIVAIYPNPSTGTFTVEFDATDIVNMTMINAIGEVVYKVDRLEINGAFTHQIDLANVAEGIYYLKMSGKAINKIEKIVISK